METSWSHLSQFVLHFLLHNLGKLYRLWISSLVKFSTGHETDFHKQIRDKTTYYLLISRYVHQVTRTYLQTQASGCNNRNVLCVQMTCDSIIKKTQEFWYESRVRIYLRYPSKMCLWSYFLRNIIIILFYLLQFNKLFSLTHELRSWLFC